MIILPTLFENKDEIEILSPFPKAIHTSIPELKMRRKNNFHLLKLQL